MLPFTLCVSLNPYWMLPSPAQQLNQSVPSKNFIYSALFALCGERVCDALPTQTVFIVYFSTFDRDERHRSVTQGLPDHQASESCTIAPLLITISTCNVYNFCT